MQSTLTNNLVNLMDEPFCRSAIEAKQILLLVKSSRQADFQN